MIFAQNILNGITDHTRKKNLHKKFNRTNLGVYSTRIKVISI